MDTVTTQHFFSDLPEYHILDPQQQENASRLVSISKEFHTRAQIPRGDSGVESDRTIILESGHQPNFLPHAGTWKKAFCLHRIHEILKDNGNQSVAFFGLADQNISTTRLLSKNQIPAFNKEGIVKIGFKIKESDKFKSFCSVPKPPAEDWQNEITRIRQYYRDIAKKNRSADPDGIGPWDQVLEILWSSYETSRNFAELNAFIFAKTCNHLFGPDIHFFLYSDLHHNNFFIKESATVLNRLAEFNQKYNQVINQNGLHIPPVAPDHMPFWFECSCGAKIDLFLVTPFTSTAKCPLCAREYHPDFGEGFKNLGRYYDKMDFNAVSRNMIMAQGLGDTLFLSGSGGSLQYGLISDAISAHLGYHRPLGLSWRSQDRYLGLTHKTAVFELMKTFSLTARDFLDDAVGVKIFRSFDGIRQQINEAQRTNDQKNVKYWTGTFNNSKNMVAFCKKTFLVTPSFLDILRNFEREEITESWRKALLNPEIQKNDKNYQICADVQYPVHSFSDIRPEEVPVLYDQIKKIVIDP
jgi:hypothetical protein